jgi:hypothetical protein
MAYNSLGHPDLGTPHRKILPCQSPGGGPTTAAAASRILGAVGAGLAADAGKPAVAADAAAGISANDTPRRRPWQRRRLVAYVPANRAGAPDGGSARPARVQG